jgi:transposase
MSRLNLTSGQRRGLRQQLVATKDVRLYRRTLAVLEFDRGRPAAEVAAMLGVTRQSVYNWVEAYTSTLRPGALDDTPGSGRHGLLDEDDWRLLDALLATAPQDLGYPNTSWTVPLLQEALARGAGRAVSDDTIRRALHRLDYVWKRPRYVLAPDPQREKKTPHPPADSGPAASECSPGPRRERPAAVPAVAGGLVEAEHGREGLAERS